MEKALAMLKAEDIAAALVIIVCALILTAVLGRVQKHIREKIDISNRAGALIDTVFRAAKFIVWLITVMAVLEVIGLSIKSVIAGVGVAGAVVGLAMQDMLKDIMMGFHIINDNSFRVGDVVKINGDEGEVTSFTLLSTQYRSTDTGDSVTVCNRSISTVARSSGAYVLDLGIAYEESEERVREALTAAAADIDGLDNIKTAKYLGIKKFEDSAIIYSIRYEADPKEKWAAYRSAMAALQKAVDAYGLKIPYPQIELHTS